MQFDMPPFCFIIKMKSGDVYEKVLTASGHAGDI